MSNFILSPCRPFLFDLLREAKSQIDPKPKLKYDQLPAWLPACRKGQADERFIGAKKRDPSSSSFSFSSQQPSNPHFWGGMFAAPLSRIVANSELENSYTIKSKNGNPRKWKSSNFLLKRHTSNVSLALQSISVFVCMSYASLTRLAKNKQKKNRPRYSEHPKQQRFHSLKYLILFVRAYTPPIRNLIKAQAKRIRLEDLRGLEKTNKK